MCQSGHPAQEPIIANFESRYQEILAENSTDHRKQLKALQFRIGKDFAQLSEVCSSQRLFIAGAALARIGQLLAAPSQQRIAAPGFAKHRYAVRLQDTFDFLPCNGQVEMMQNRIAPNGVEAGI